MYSAAITPRLFPQFSRTPGTPRVETPPTVAIRPELIPTSHREAVISAEDKNPVTNPSPLATYGTVFAKQLMNNPVAQALAISSFGAPVAKSVNYQQQEFEPKESELMFVTAA